MEAKKSNVVGKVAAEAFKQSFDMIQSAAYATARSKGWWPEQLDVNHGEQLALMHSELSEGLEYLRHGNGPSDHIPAFSGLEEELADVIIRIMSYAGRTNLKVSEAVLAKMEFNAGRPHKHGGKAF
jgi:NTP pyrophosphatase (non-canonical NTP hydrolase)